MVRKMTAADLEDCAEILRSVYNNEMWRSSWDFETAAAYLSDFFEAKKFVGFVLEEGGAICGALFSHEKIWWNNSELFIDEMFVRPDLQRQGYGSKLLEAAEKTVKECRLAGFTLSTNRYAPAHEFYKKNGFVDCEHVLFMGKEIN